MVTLASWCYFEQQPPPDAQHAADAQQPAEAEASWKGAKIIAANAIPITKFLMMSVSLLVFDVHKFRVGLGSKRKRQRK